MRGADHPDKKKIMLAAHMDEIGMQVKKIEADGRIKVCNVGWIWTSSLYNDKVVFRNGTIGVVGCEGPIEEAKNNSGKLYIDIGCTTKEDTEKYVKVGDYCGFIGNYYELKNGRITAKSFDNRVGCYILIEALKQNKGDGPNDVCTGRSRMPGSSRLSRTDQAGYGNIRGCDSGSLLPYRP